MSERSMESSFLQYWGKTSRKNDRLFHPLAYHGLDAAAVAICLLKNDSVLYRRIMQIGGIAAEDFLNLVGFITAMHDIGKFSDAFQSLSKVLYFRLKHRKPSKGYFVKHDDLGLILWKDILSKLVMAKLTEKIDLSGIRRSMGIRMKESISILMQTATGHHGVPSNSTPSGISVSLKTHFTDVDVKAAENFVESIINIFPLRKWPWQEDLFKMNERLKLSTWPLAGLIVASDWIASDNDYFPYHEPTMSVDKYWNDIALPLALKAINSTGFVPEKMAVFDGVEDIFELICEPSAMQIEMKRIDIGQEPSLIIIEDTTGSGKTEAALYCANRLINSGSGNGIYFGLPTMATANAMYERISAACERLFPGNSPFIVLAHSARDMSRAFLDSDAKNTDELRLDESYKASWLSDNRKKALLAQIGVGTIDQALLAVLPVRHQSLRALGLARNVLIMDEVHAYDPYTNLLLCRLLEYHSAMGGSCILLSATLPDNLKNKFSTAFSKGCGINQSDIRTDSYPALTLISSKGSSIRYPESTGLSRTLRTSLQHDSEEVIAELIRLALDGKCCCWIRNTVADAVEAWKKLSELYDQSKLLLFHSRFMLGDRLDIENEVLRNFGKTSKAEYRKGKIVIATQVVEQSLDLDFDEMFSDLAPMDLLLQRAGRLHRHKRNISGDISLIEEREDPLLRVLGPEPVENPSEDWYEKVFRRGSYVYPDHARLWLTARYLKMSTTIQLPQDSRRIIEFVYGDDADIRIPEGLKDKFFNNLGKTSADRALGILNALVIENGYSLQSSQWWDDDGKIATRIGQPSSNLLLLAIRDNQVVPLYPDVRAELSRVSLPARGIDGAGPENTGDQEILEAALSDFPCWIRWTTPLLMREREGIYISKMISSEGRKMKVCYRKDTGAKIQS